ncbi:MAG: hypothetical protein LBM64_01625 [Deltaproteobacteria bacterium]|jgi:23S rRNA (uracil1939-C5)-methyltransferase|nr:hypothetical protein [Deltaproteobacteria bacterium]
MNNFALPEMGSRLELEICDLNVDGSAVARHAGRVCFLDRGLPGERVLAEVTGQKKRALLARVLETLAPSPDEVRPFCPYFGECGGCALQNLSYPAQLRFKQQRARQVLSRIGGVAFSGLPDILPSPRLAGYRNKMEYAFGQEDSGAVRLGLKRRASNEVLDLESCPLQSPAAGAVLRAVRAWARANGLAPRSLVLREPEYLKEGVRQRSAELVCAAAPAPALLDKLWAALAGEGVTSLLITLKISGAAGQPGRPVKLYGPRSLWEEFGTLLLEFPLDGFAQTNTGAAALLYAKAAEYAGLRAGETLWDVYSGAGALALYIGKEAGSILGLEQNAAAVQAARANAARLGPHPHYGRARFEAGEAARLLPALALKLKNKRPDLLVADPPRGGMSARVLEGIVKARPGRLLYVSCDPATLARDLAGLGPFYRLRSLALVDMFPHTPHLEAVAALDLAPGPEYS